MSSSGSASVRCKCNCRWAKTSAKQRKSLVPRTLPALLAASSQRWHCSMMRHSRSHTREAQRAGDLLQHLQ